MCKPSYMSSYLLHTNSEFNNSVASLPVLVPFCFWVDENICEAVQSLVQIRF